MDYETTDDGVAIFHATVDEVLTPRHCVIEALEALGEAEFSIRTGAPKPEAERLLATLKRASVELTHRGGP